MTTEDGDPENPRPEVPYPRFGNTGWQYVPDESTLDVDRSLTRELWEVQYMYVISFLGGLWVAGRFVQGGDSTVSASHSSPTQTSQRHTRSPRRRA